MDRKELEGHVAANAIDTRAIVATLVLREHALSRNKHFALFLAPAARLARARAGALRNVIRQLSGAMGPALGIALAERGDGDVSLRYSLPRVSLQRTVSLTSFELALVRVSLSRAGAKLLPARLRATEGDEQEVEAAAASLHVGDKSNRAHVE